MFWKYLIALFVVLAGASFIILLLVFLTSVALYGSVLLPLACVASLVVFFYMVSLLNKKQES